MALCAADTNLHRAGVALAAAIYIPIVLFRWITVMRFWPVSSMTVAVGIMETALLVAALLLFRKP